MTTAICAIAKMENDYINDWCEYHLNLGFDKIYIYDNNDTNYEPIENRINKEYLDKITIFKIPGMTDFQRPKYTEFYKNYSSQFDWCAYIDIDEFIVLKDWKSIHDFLSDQKFKDANVIRLEWHIYGDNDDLNQDVSIPVYKRITKESDTNYRKHFGKTIIKSGLKNVNFASCHVPSIDGSLPEQYDVDGDTGIFKPALNRRYESAYIAHYMTKTLGEFINQKLYRQEKNGYPGGLMGSNNDIDRVRYFFRVNKITTDKILKLESLGFNLDNILKEKGAKR